MAQRVAKSDPRFFLDRDEPFLRADELTWDLGRQDEDPYGLDREWRHNIFFKYPKPFGKRLAREYKAIYVRDGRHAAAWWLSQVDLKLACIDFKLALSEAQIRATADEAAWRARSAAIGDMAGDLLVATTDRLCHLYGLPGPADLSSATIRRLMCRFWWRRNIRRVHGMRFETAVREANFVNRRKGIYASDETVARRRDQKVRMREMLREMIAQNECGDELSLEELADRSESNPKNRRAALMVRIYGFEAEAKRLGFVGEFYTITCPGRMHASLSRSCDENPRFDGTSPREGQEYLNCQWKKARAKLNRDAVPYFGFRIAEPQHDGTPHWHLLLFVAPENRTNLREIIRHYALEVDPDEPGAVKHRFKAVEIDWSKGSATGYVAKYVSKNIDGYGVKNDTYGKDAKSSAIRVEAWASTWRIRQFAQVGGPPVGVWRELRRLHGQTVASSTVVAAAVAADKADWAGYVQAQGGAVCKRRDRPIRLAKVWSDEPGRYGDPKGYSTIGIEENGVTILTRIHIWKILPKGSGGTLDHGAAGRATHLRSGPRMAQPGGGQAADARTAGVPVSSVPLEFCQ